MRTSTWARSRSWSARPARRRARPRRDRARSGRRSAREPRPYPGGRGVTPEEAAPGPWEQESPRTGPLDVVYIDWHIHPFRAERWFEIWKPGAARAMAFGAKGWSLTRNVEEPPHFRPA